MTEWKSKAVFYYKDVRFVGGGRSASVYRALREDANGHSSQKVALKVLNCEKSLPWLAQEFALLSRIDSPHCVRVLGWDEVREGNALVLEWVDGVTLYDLAREQALSPEHRDELIAQAQAGLTALHAAGFHHGDLSPKNILVDREGRLRIIDFGSETAERGTLIGTPPYIAPEIWLGEPTSAAGDLFALGLIAQDLETSFLRVPMGEECRERALRPGDEESPWADLFRREPATRKMLSLRSNLEARREIGTAVRASLDARDQMATAALPSLITTFVTRKSMRARWVSRLAYVAMIFAFGLPVQARAPLANESGVKAASLVFRAQRWMAITVNGKEAGYAPFELSRLQPGLHHLKWKTTTASGEMRFELASGQVLELSEADLLAGGAPGKRL